MSHTHTYTETEHTGLGRAPGTKTLTNTKVEVKATFDVKPVYSTSKSFKISQILNFNLSLLPLGEISV